jgi:hypothetical protein
MISRVGDEFLKYNHDLEVKLLKLIVENTEISISEAFHLLKNEKRFRTRLDLAFGGIGFDADFFEAFAYAVVNLAPLIRVHDYKLPKKSNLIIQIVVDETQLLKIAHFKPLNNETMIDHVRESITEKKTNSKIIEILVKDVYRHYPRFQKFYEIVNPYKTLYQERIIGDLLYKSWINLDDNTILVKRKEDEGDKVILDYDIFDEDGVLNIPMRACNGSSEQISINRELLDDVAPCKLYKYNVIRHSISNPNFGFEKISDPCQGKQISCFEVLSVLTNFIFCIVANKNFDPKE